MLATCRDRRSSCTVAAFTLVELLVVIAIIGILVALLLPAVQAAREAGRRMQCANHLKQIALAVHNYASANGSLPPGGVVEGPCCTTKSFSNWAIAILPYIELQTVYDQYDEHLFNEDPVNHSVRTTFVNLYMCPSESNQNHLDRRDSGPGSHLFWAPGTYVAVTGQAEANVWWGNYNTGGARLPMESRGAMHTVGNPGPQADPSRVLGTERMANIRDGTSNTMLVGERSIHSPHLRRTAWAYSYGQYNKSAAYRQTRTLLLDYDHCVRIGGLGGSNPCKRGFSSFHPNGMQFGYCDGSVHLFDTNIDMELFVAMATIDGGESVPPLK